MLNILKGILVAVATIVPGVSGGTMMIILGVYDKSIEAVSAFISRKIIHKKLMIQLIIGGVLGLLLFSKAMLWLIEDFPFIMSFLFLGIVLVGLAAIFKRIRWDQFKSFHILFLFAGIAIAVAMTYGESSALFDFSGSMVRKLIMILIAGIIIAVALILPGISTSFLLLALGLYEDFLRAVQEFDMGFLIPLGIGVVLGVLLTTKALEYCLKEHATPTYLMILGFILGSFGEIYIGWPEATQGKITCIIALILGAGIMISIQLLMKKFPEHDD